MVLRSCFVIVWLQCVFNIVFCVEVCCLALFVNKKQCGVCVRGLRLLYCVLCGLCWCCIVVLTLRVLNCFFKGTVFFVFFLYVSCVCGVCYHVVLCIVVYAVLFMFLMFFC